MLTKPIIILKIINRNGRRVKMVRSTKKKRIYWILQVGKWKNHTFLLRVIYNFKKDYINEGEYCTKRGLIHALRCFTETDLVKDFMNEDESQNF